MRAALISTIIASCAMGGAVLDDFEGKEEWEFSDGPEFPGAAGKLLYTDAAAHSGECGARVLFDFNDGGRYVAIYHDLPADPPISHITFRIRKTTPNSMCMRVEDSAGETFQKRFSVTSPEWQQVRVDITGGWGGWWGEASDGVFEGAPTRMGLLIEPHEGGKLGWADIDDVRVESMDRQGGLSESEYTVLDFSAEAGWQRRSNNPGESYNAGVVVHGAGTAHLAAPSTTLLGEPQTLTLRLSTETPGTTVSMRLWSHFQAFDRELGIIKEAGEHQLTAYLGPMTDWKHSGGQNDGAIHGGLRLGEVYLRRPEGSGQAITMLSEVRVRSHAAPGRAIFGVLRSEAGPSARFELGLRSLSREKIRAAARYEMRTLSGELLHRGAQSVELPPAAEEVSVPAAAPFGTHALLEATFTLHVPGQEDQKWVASCARPKGLPRIGTGPESPIGMGMYMYRYNLSPESQAEQERLAEMGAAAGVRWSREEFGWARMEPRKGKFEWEFYDRLLDRAEAHGISVYALLSYWSGWTKPNTAEGIDDYCTWVRACVERYRDRVKYWEVWNEPNIFFWTGPREMYAELLRKAYETIKDVDPSAEVMGMSTSGIDTAFIRQMMDLGAPFDILTIHPYRGRMDSALFIDELRECRQMVRRRDGSYREMWITEMGWPTVPGQRSERMQAGLLSRVYLAAIASGVVRNVSWYDFRDDGVDPLYHEMHFGVMQRDFSPKPGYYALAAAARHMQGVQSAEEIETGEGIIAYRYHTRLGDVLAIWAEGSDRTVALGGLMPGSRVRSFVDGQVESPRLAGPGSDTLIALHDGEPVYISPASDRVTVSVDPVALVMTPETAKAGEVIRLRCEMPATTVRHEVSFELPLGWSQRKTGRDSARVILPPSLSPGEYDIWCVLELPEGELRIRRTMRLLPEVVEIR